MDYGSFPAPRTGFVKMHAQLRYKAAEKRIRVETVDSTVVSLVWGTENSPRTSDVPLYESGVWVRRYQADVNAAFNIVDRYLSGESPLRERTDNDDSAEDGAV